MDINQFLAIGVVGAFLSLMIEFFMKEISNPLLSKMVVLVSAIVVGAVYVLLHNTPYFQTVMTILGSASIVYGFFLNKK